MTNSAPPPILASKHHDEPSEFVPENLLRGARRQKGLADDLVRTYACSIRMAKSSVRPGLLAAPSAILIGPACYHTELYRLTHEGIELGIVPCAVGAPFAVRLRLRGGQMSKTVVLAL